MAAFNENLCSFFCMKLLYRSQSDNLTWWRVRVYNHNIRFGVDSSKKENDTSIYFILKNECMR